MSGLESLKNGVRGLKAEDLSVVFQPIVDLQKRRIFAYEGLVRTQAEGFASPKELLEAAEEEQAMGRLGRTIREIMMSRAERRALFVNLHPEELSARWLVRPDDPINLHDGLLFLEITEAAAFDYYDLCRGVLREICARTGAHLVVDDFGAGYSNLKRIVDLEPAVVKLDIQLVRGLDQCRRQRLLVSNVVRMCDELGAKVVAEGIETWDELQAVIDAGCHYGQGFLLARPAWPMPECSWPKAGDAIEERQG